MNELLADIRYGARILRRTPGFTAVVILVLGIGIGANTAILSAVDAMLIRPLPYPDAERLMNLWEDWSHSGFPRNTTAVANFVDWRGQNTVFTDMAAYRFHTLNLSSDGTPEQIRGIRAMPNLVAILGVPPLLGRWLEERDENAGERVVVINHSLWQRRFGGDRNLIGRTIPLSHQSYTVVGIMPAGFHYPSAESEFYVPSGLGPAEFQNRMSHVLQVAARLKANVSLEQARTEMSAIGKRLAQAYPRSNDRAGVVVQPLREALLGRRGLELLVLLAGSACVLLIACANIANLLLARSSARWREMAVRSALGAGGARLARQHLTESLLLAGLGGVTGLMIAGLTIPMLESLVPPSLVGLEIPAVDGRVLALTFVVALLTGLLFGAVPAWQASRVVTAESLREGNRTGASRRRRIFRNALVAGEVALASTLLAGAGLLVQTLSNLLNTDLGFEPRKVLTARTRLPLPRYADPGKRVRFYEEVLTRVQAVPGVQSAGYVSTLPFLQRGNSTGFRIEGMPPIPVDSLLRPCTNQYLTTIGSRVVEGRLFGKEDRAATQRVIILNETFKKAFFPNESALGKRISVDRSDWFTVVGVVQDILERGLEQTAKPGFYFLISQQPDTWASPAEIAVKTSADPVQLAGALRSAIWDVDREQPVTNLRTLTDIVASEVAGRSEQVRFLSVFAGLALFLACLGIYGVLSYSVTLQKRDIGVRMALGARAGDVVAMVVLEGMRMAMLGLCAGVIAAFATTRLMGSLLYGVQPADGVTFAAVCVLIAAVSGVACYLPARRASRIDPLMALRQD